VRIGNAAASQLQLDIYGELMDALCVARKAGLADDDDGWSFQRTLVTFLESNWQRADSGIWEMRGEPRHFTHSKVMCWVAMDRAIEAVEKYGLKGPVERWRDVRARIHADVCANGYDAARGTFVQSYGSSELDASLLLIPQVGFLPASDPRVRGTVEAIERDLVVDGLVLRYRTHGGVDGLPAGEGHFLPCSFWLADALALLGRRADAEALFERLLTLRNDVGLLSEEYDLRNRRALGNTPQSMTHMALINTARNLSERGGPAEHRSSTSGAAPPGGPAQPASPTPNESPTTQQHTNPSDAAQRPAAASQRGPKSI